MISFKVKKKLLSEAMGRLGVIIPTKDSGTLLSHVLLTVGPTDISITASDMESTVRISIPADETKEGEVIVKGKKLSDIASAMKSEYLIFSAKEQDMVEEGGTDTGEPEKSYQIMIKGGEVDSAKYKMPGGSRSHFPEVNTISEDKLSTISASLLLEMINKTFYAISHEENRYIYSGLYMKSNDNQLTVVGTDGRRLSAVTRKLPKSIKLGYPKSDDPDDIVVYSKAIEELKTLLSNTETMIQLGVEQKDIFFKVDNAELSSRLLEGKFPDYEQVIPKEKKINLQMNRRTLVHAFEEVMVMTEEPSRQILMQLKKGSLHFKANTLDVGESEKMVSVDYQGDDISIYFNGSYMQDILKNVHSDEVLISIEDENKPIMVHDPEDPDFVSLVMPMRV